MNEEEPRIHGTAYIGPDVILENGVIIGHNVVIKGPAHIGENTQICPGAIIGLAAEARSQETDWQSPITIGPETVIREHAVIQRALKGGPGTSLGRNCYIMHAAHIAHDCILEDDVTLSPFAALGGHSYLFQGANLGIHAATHQKTVIGAYAMIGMGAICIHHIPPGAIAVGVPAEPIKRNRRGILNAEATNEELDRLKERYGFKIQQPPYHERT